MNNPIRFLPSFKAKPFLIALSLLYLLATGRVEIIAGIVIGILIGPRLHLSQPGNQPPV